MATNTRLLSDNELSYFLQGRQDGVNDMSLHVTFDAPATIVTSFRVSIVWAILRLRHPLLASTVKMDLGAYNDAQFSYTLPSSPTQAILEARSNLEVSSNTAAEDLLDHYFNGPRLLSAERLSFLYIITRPEATANIRSYDMLMFVPHFLSDGVGVHRVGNLFFALLGGLTDPGAVMRSDAQLLALLEAEWADRWAAAGVQTDLIPSPAEAGLNSPLSTKFQKAVAMVDFKARQARFIGGHAFPPVPTRSRQVVTYNLVFDSNKTQAMLSKCKSEGVTISNALYVICNFAWIRANRAAAAQSTLSLEQRNLSETLPMMIYTAINLRPYLTAHTPSYPEVPASFFFLAIAYFNIVLPSFIPSTSKPASVFWHRARSVKSQGRKYISSPMFASRTLIMSKERAKRSKKFAKEDDALLSLNPSGQAATSPSPSLTPSVIPQAPSVALLGLSQLGNLDYIYPAASYPYITLTSIIGHTRRGKGGILMFSHTFRGKLYLMPEWDKAGFKEGVVEGFWSEVVQCVEEFLVGTEMEVAAKL